MLLHSITNPKMPVLNALALVQFGLNGTNVKIQMTCDKAPTNEKELERGMKLGTMIVYFGLHAIFTGVDSQVQYTSDEFKFGFANVSETMEITNPFIALVASGRQTPTAYLMTNILDSDALIGAIMCIQAYTNKAITQTGQDYVSYLVEYLSDPHAHVSEESSVMHYLFQTSSIAIVCSSKQEYAKMRKDLMNDGYIVNETVQPEGWNDVCKYVLYDSNRGIVYSTFRLPKNVETTVNYHDFCRD